MYRKELPLKGISFTVRERTKILVNCEGLRAAVPPHFKEPVDVVQISDQDVWTIYILYTGAIMCLPREEV